MDRKWWISKGHIIMRPGKQLEGKQEEKMKDKKPLIKKGKSSQTISAMIQLAGNNQFAVSNLLNNMYYSWHTIMTSIDWMVKKYNEEQ